MRERPTNEEFAEFIRLFYAAFLEVMNVAKKRIDDTTVPRHFDYPGIHKRANGFPSISRGTQAPTDYTSLFRGQGLLGLGYDFPVNSFPGMENLVKWVGSNEKFQTYFASRWVSARVSGYIVRDFVVESVDRYIHRFKTGEVDKDRFFAVFAPIYGGIAAPKLKLSVAVPIALTRFDFDHVKLTHDCYIFRMHDRFQLARSRATYYGSGAHESVTGAATHCFLSRDWELSNESTFIETSDVLGRFSAYPAEYIDKFFAALRLVTGHDTGYAQAMFVPRGWTFQYYANLPQIYGVTVRRYPSTFDDYGWLREDLPSISRAEAKSVGKLFASILSRNEKRIAIAVKRLNNCLLRDDFEDALLDATVGLEVLLGDGDSQAVGYKLALRAAAIAKLDPRKRFRPIDVYRGIKGI